MRRIFHIAFAITLSLFLFSCHEEDNEMKDAFMQNRDEIRLEVNGETIFSYNPEKCQIAFCPDKLEYRAYFSDNDGNDMSDFFSLTLSGKPVFGEEVEGELTWTKKNTIENKHLSFETVKTGSDGKIWLWNKSYNIGITVKTLK